MKRHTELGLSVNGFLAWFLMVPPALQAALIGAATSFFLFVLGLGTIMLTAAANRRNATKAIADKQRLEIYQEALTYISAASKSGRKVRSYVLSTAGSLELWRKFANDGMKSAPPQQRYQTFAALHKKHSKRISNVVAFLENWAVVEPRLKLFRYALFLQSDKLMRQSTMVAYEYSKFLAFDDLLGPALDMQPPTEPETQQFRAVCDRYVDIAQLLDAYLGDLNVELQALLLGHLFGTNVERRDAPDPDRYAIRLDRYEDIIAKFEKIDIFQAFAANDAKLRQIHGTSKGINWSKRLLPRFRHSSATVRGFLR